MCLEIGEACAFCHSGQLRESLRFGASRFTCRNGITFVPPRPLFLEAGQIMSEAGETRSSYQQHQSEKWPEQRRHSSSSGSKHTPPGPAEPPPNSSDSFEFVSMPYLGSALACFCAVSDDTRMTCEMSIDDDGAGQRRRRLFSASWPPSVRLPCLPSFSRRGRMDAYIVPELGSSSGLY